MRWRPPCLQHVLMSALVCAWASGCAQLPAQAVPAPPKAQQPLVVVDIDGTLTPAVLAAHEARPAAAEVLAAYVAKGYGLAYITARTPLAQAGLPGWLSRMGFPAAALHVAQSAAERADVAGFKAGVIRAYAQRGWRLAWAYGDSTTDFDAYAQAGFAREQVFALRRRGDTHCQPGTYAQCLDGWEPLRQPVAQLPDAR